MPNLAVVEPDCRVHGLPNLFAADGSVFPTGCHANPTLTVLALTLPLGEHIRHHAKDMIHEN